MTKSTNANKTVIANNAKVAPAAVISATPAVPAAPKKADKARAIFAEMYAQSPVPARKDMLARVQAEAQLTKAGSATYLQNYKTKNNLVVKKAAAAVKA